MTSKAYQLLQDIGFERMSGTDNEAKAAQIILNYLKELGLEGHLEAFKVNTSDITKAK
ncbi:MAG: hypothetical protein HUJ56_10680, partial [Erysipelotrichaceae bacterium]|nr:hypothetical protein [Erysipelotrichaceae bacterium]